MTLKQMIDRHILTECKERLGHERVKELLRGLPENHHSAQIRIRHAAKYDQGIVAQKIGITRWQLSKWMHHDITPRQRYRKPLKDLIGYEVKP